MERNPSDFLVMAEHREALGDGMSLLRAAGDTSAPSSFWDSEVWGAGLLLETGKADPGWGRSSPVLGWPDSSNKNIECPVQFAFEIKNKYLKNINRSRILNETSYKNSLII